MGFTIELGLMLVLLLASTMAVSTAQPYGNCNTHTSNKILVGDHNHWKYGYNYTKWAFRHGPFYLKDTLVFKYDPPAPNTFPHNVYLLPNYESFLKCDFTNAQEVANETQGTGEGFEFVLEKPWQPHYFACGVHDGIHCLNGTMKFFVIPIFPLV